MPAALKSKEDVVEILSEVFRRHGYDGATLAILSQATGLVKASLYHHFPAGKQDMARAVLDHLGEKSKNDVLGPINFEAAPRLELQALCARLIDYFQAGRVSCILDVFSVGQARALFQETLALRVKRIATAFARLLQKAGMAEAQAIERGWEAIVVIEGALVVARASATPQVFVDALHRLPERLLQT